MKAEKTLEKVTGISPLYLTDETGPNIKPKEAKEAMKHIAWDILREYVKETVVNYDEERLRYDFERLYNQQEG
jgi:hypothetical protein